MIGKTTCDLRGNVAFCFEFSVTDVEVDVRTCRRMTEKDKRRPIDFKNGVVARKIIKIESENDLSEGRSSKLNESSDCMYCRIEDEIAVDCLPLVNIVFGLNGIEVSLYNEVFQVGENGEGEWKFDV